MNLLKLIFNNLNYYKKSNILIVLGTMISTAVLIGALIIGDSVSYSLDKIVNHRLGKTSYALSSGERFFRTKLANEIENSLNVAVTPLLQTKGMIVIGGGQARLNNINVYGVNEKFDQIAESKNFYSNLSADEIIINSHIAKKMKLKIGDEFLLRFEKLDSMPKETALSDDEEATIAKRYTIKYIATDEQLGRFGLRNEQVAPNNVFVSLDELSEEMEISTRSNMMLVEEHSSLTVNKLNRVLKSKWNLTDSGLELKKIAKTEEVELSSKRIFIDSQTNELSIEVEEKPKNILTYFVNQISSQEYHTPYSFISSTDKDPLITNLNEDEIIITDWLARDLKVKSGSDIIIKYFVLGDQRNLVEKESKFIVKKIIPIKGKYADQSLMPAFPGLTETESCMDWHPGIPVNFDKIRKKDEYYWDKYKGTPKAYISLKTAQKLWGNRFGNLTSIRFKNLSVESVENKLNNTINPEDWGIKFLEVKSKALSASSQAVNFTGLFIGLSFFVILASLILTALLFILNVEKRAQEQGILLGIGYSKKLIKKIILTETFFLVLIGSFFGVFLGIAYNSIILIALKSIWSDIVGTSSLEIFIQPVTLISGFFISVVLTLLVVYAFVNKQIKNTAHILQRGINKLTFLKNNRKKTSLTISVLCFLTGLFLTIFINPGKGSEVFGQFFVIGILILSSGIFFANYLIDVGFTKSVKIKLNINLIARKGIGLNKKRSLLLVSLLATGLFLVFTVGINKKITPQDFDNRNSGLGGFDFIGQTSIPFYNDLNNSKVRKELGLLNSNADFIQIKVKEGDDASCLNLNRVTIPQILGIDSEKFADINPFSFVSISKNLETKPNWKLLDLYLGENIIPAIANETDIIWQMGRSVGDTLDYIDDYGNSFKIKLVAGLANSILQGNVIISKKNFIEKFPTINGSKLFLVDNVLNRKKFAKLLSSNLIDYGLTLDEANLKLAEYNKIENTYLTIFMILGSFGVFIGSFGLGIVVIRNVNEQKNEMALLIAVGYSKKMIIKIVVTTHIILIFTGVVIGVLAAIFASLPSILSTGSEIPFLTLVVIVLLVTLNGVFWTYFASHFSLKENLLLSLRRE